MADTCSCGNSRSFSWLVKSCLPDPSPAHPAPGRPAPQLALPRPPPPAPPRRVDPSPCSSSPSSSTFLSSLPEDLLLECLSRVPLPSLPSLSLVCRRFSLLLDSPSFIFLRRAHGLLRRSLLALSPSDRALTLLFSCPCSYPLDAAAAADADAAPWDPPARLPLPSASFAPGLYNCRLVPLGRCVYALGRGAAYCYDTWRGAAVSCAPTLFPRKKFAAASFAGKIYVAGGSARTSAVEEYDPVTDAWRVVAEAPRGRYGCVGAAADGVFYVIGGLKVSSCGEAPRGGRLDAHTCAGTMDLYDIQAKAWLRPRSVPGGGCIVGACATGGGLYVLASHAVELSFWRWNGKAAGRGRRKRAGCEWARLPSPPVPPQAQMGGAGRFSCVGVGESRVVLLVHVACISPSTPSAGGDGGRRGGRSFDKEGQVLVYDAVSEDWSHGGQLPPAMGRAACVCVEC